MTTLLTLRPAMVFFDWAASRRLQAWVAASRASCSSWRSSCCTDFSQYWVHRAFHRVPLLWRFHAIHHSAEMMDWLPGRACTWWTWRSRAG